MANISDAALPALRRRGVSGLVAAFVGDLDDRQAAVADGDDVACPGEAVVGLQPCRSSPGKARPPRTGSVHLAVDGYSAA
jgi:hypothetical protein